MALPELETLARLRLPMLVVVYNDAAYGAEVHHFGPQGTRSSSCSSPTPTSPRSPCRRRQGLTVRASEDLAAIEPWLGERDGPLVVDAKITPDFCAEWLEEAFK